MSVEDREGQVRVYCAVSLDGFIAGPDDDLGWLGDGDTGQVADPRTVSFAAFLEQTGAVLMGRRTFEVVLSFGGEWPYGAIPVLVATTRPLPPAPGTVIPCCGGIKQLCERAAQVAGKKTIYLDGGQVITQALDEGCVDELVLTMAPVFLGDGVPLYRGKRLQRFHVEYLGRLNEMLQIKLTHSSAKG